MPMNPVTTITFFKFTSLKNKMWAFKMMRDAPRVLQKIKGQTFFKLMGSGKNKGFNPLPDWSVYCLLQTWQDLQAADTFLQQSSLIAAYRAHCEEVWSLYMRSLRAKGTWEGEQPFLENEAFSADNSLLAVLTRGTMKTSKLYAFWKQAAVTQQVLHQSEGLIYSKGIAEVPITQIATFSIWQNTDAMKAFAFRTQAHRDAMKKTHTIQWFKEDLYARFQPFKSVGTWLGTTLLPQLSTENAKM